jgi:hypothetical protein
MNDLQQEHPDIHENLARMQVLKEQQCCMKPCRRSSTSLIIHSEAAQYENILTRAQAKLPEELDEYLDQVILKMASNGICFSTVPTNATAHFY